MRAHYLQHVPYEGLGCIRPWLQRKGYMLTSTRWFLDEPLPDPAKIDFLVVLGGPMGVADTLAYPWLNEEKRFLASMIASGKPMLGICLGAQLIAEVAGGRVRPNRFKEIGWFPVTGCEPAGQAFRFPSSLPVFHWHGDTFEPPPGAVHTACSAACENQAFQLSRRIVGLQFHLEVTPQAVRSMIEHGRHELQGGPFIQPEEAILGATPQVYAAANAQMAQLLDYLLTADAADR